MLIKKVNHCRLLLNLVLLHFLINAANGGIYKQMMTLLNPSLQAAVSARSLQTNRNTQIVVDEQWLPNNIARAAVSAHGNSAP